MSAASGDSADEEQPVRAKKAKTNPSEAKSPSQRPTAPTPRSSVPQKRPKPAEGRLITPDGSVPIGPPSKKAKANKPQPLRHTGLFFRV